MEEGVILRGCVCLVGSWASDYSYGSPQPGQLDVYMDTLGRLNAAIAFKAFDADSRESVRNIFFALCPLINSGNRLV